MNTNTATAIKRHVGENLHLADVDGTPWATNRYWMAPAEKLAPLLDKFNVDPKSAGTYEVNGTVHKRNDDAPKMERFLDVADYTQALEPMRIRSGDGTVAAYARTGDGKFLAMFLRPDLASVGIRADWLEWLSETPHTYGEDFANIRYAQTDKTLGPVAVLADKRIQHGGHIGDDGKWVPVTYETTGTVILAVVMSCKPA